MIEEISSVVPDNEQTVKENSKDNKEKKVDGTKVARGVAMSAAIAAAAGTGAAVAHAMEADDVVPDAEEMVEVDTVEVAASAPAGHQADTPHHVPDAPEAVQPHDGNDGLREPHMSDEVDPDGDNVIDIDGGGEIVDDVPDFVEQPEIGSIDVQIDETIDFDEPIGFDA